MVGERHNNYEVVSPLPIGIGMGERMWRATLAILDASVWTSESRLEVLTSQDTWTHVIQL